MKARKNKTSPCQSARRGGGNLPVRTREERKTLNTVAHYITCIDFSLCCLAASQCAIAFVISLLGLGAEVKTVNRR